MYRQSEKNLLNSGTFSTCPNSTVNFSPLTADIGWRVWGTQANFNGLCVLALLLHQRCLTEVNQTLHDVCRLLALAPNGILPGAKFTLRPSLCILLLAVLLHGT